MLCYDYDYGYDYAMKSLPDFSMSSVAAISSSRFSSTIIMRFKDVKNFSWTVSFGFVDLFLLLLLLLLLLLFN